MQTLEYIKDNVMRLIKENSFKELAFEGDKNIFIDFDFDSLAYSAFIVDVEDFFGVSITKEEIENGLTTPNQMVQLLMNKLA